MANNRNNIVAALQAVLTGLPITSTNVFLERVYNESELELPCIRLNQGTESVEYISSAQQREEVRVLDFEIECKATAANSVITILNNISSDVEFAISASALLGGLLRSYRLINTDNPNIDGKGGAPVGAISLLYEFTYYTVEGEI